MIRKPLLGMQSRTVESQLTETSSEPFLIFQCIDIYNTCYYYISEAVSIHLPKDG